MNATLTKIAIGGFTICLFLLTLSCATDIKNKINPFEPKSKVIDPNLLYFNNVRAAFYNKSSSEELKGFEQYEWRNGGQLKDKAVVKARILRSTEMSKAFVQIVPSTFWDEGEQLRVNWKDTISQQSGVYVLEKRPISAPYTFASQLYISCHSDHELWVEKEGERYPLFDGGEGRVAFLKTMRDFYELVGVD